MTCSGEPVGAAATDAFWTQMAREQPRIGSTSLYTARALTCEYATCRDQPQLVSTADGGLIIRRSWVRAPPAPPAVLIPVVGEPWTGSYTDVGGAMFEPSGRIWSHRVAVERVWRYQGVRREGPDWLLAWLAKSMRDWTTGVAANWLSWHDAPRVV